jgi:hypothetical protein
MGRKLLGVFAMAAVLGAALWLAWPAIERECMRIPVTDAINGVRAGNIQKVRACFIPGATLGTAGRSLSVEQALRKAAPAISAGDLRGTARVVSITHVQRIGNQADADIEVMIYIDGGDDLPYHSVPMRVQGQVTLQRQGFFTWKIVRVTSDIFGELLR